MPYLGCIQGGPAHLSGELRIGQVVLEVDGQAVDQLSFKNVLQVPQKSPPTPAKGPPATAEVPPNNSQRAWRKSPANTCVLQIIRGPVGSTISLMIQVRDTIR